MSSPAAALMEPLLEDTAGAESVVVPSSRGESPSNDPRTTIIEEPHHHHHSNVVFMQHDPSCCSFIGNALWILLGGWHLCLAWIVIGILLCCTLVGIPAGMQCFHISQFVLLPFGRTITTATARHGRRRPLTCCCRCGGNVIWAITIGWILALHALVTGIVCCATILGIPWGLQCFRFLRVCIAPFGVRCNPRMTERWVDTAVRQLEEEYEPQV